jgi:hypothetical protein
MEPLGDEKVIKCSNYYPLLKRRCLLTGFLSKSALDTPLRTRGYMNSQLKFEDALVRILILAAIGINASYNEILLFRLKLGGRLTINVFKTLI